MPRINTGPCCRSWDGLWFEEPEFSEARILHLWHEVTSMFCARTNVFAVDLMNEPHAASWGTGVRQRDWAAAATRLGNVVLQGCPRWLVLVQGTADPG